MPNDKIEKIKSKFHELENRGNLSTISDVFDIIYEAFDLIKECIDELEGLECKLNQANSVIQILESTDV